MPDSLEQIFGPKQKSTPASGLDAIFADVKPPERDRVVSSGTFESDVVQSEAGVDYEKGAPFMLRLGLMKMSNPREQENFLQKQVGTGNFRKDSGGNWLIKEGEKWSAVYPRGLLGTAENAAAGGIAVAPKIGGPMLGAAVGGGAAGPPGAVLGAMGGAGLTTALEDALKYAGGNLVQSPWEALKEGGSDMLTAGAFQGAGPAWSAAKGPASNLSSKILGSKFWGAVTPESRATAQSMERLGVYPPLISAAPGAQITEYKRGLRNQIMGDPMARKRVEVIERRIGDVLDTSGLTGAARTRAMQDIKNLSAKLSPTAATEQMQAAIRGEEQLLHATDANATRMANQALDNHYRLLTNTQKRISDKKLGETFTGEYEAQGKQFRQQMNTAYGAVSQGLGDAQVIHLPQDMLRAVDPMSLPQVVRQLTEHSEDGELVFRPLSILEAHRLRTAFRDKTGVRTGDQGPIGQAGGDYYRMAGMVDDAISGFAEQSVVGEAARDALKRADQQYAQGIVRFTNEKINNLAWQVKQGRSPDPDAVAQVILNKDSADATRQLWDMLSQKTKTAVETEDLRTMLKTVATTGKDGHATVNPDALIAALNEREYYIPFVHDKRMVSELRRMATDYKALKGDIDITALSQGRSTSSEDIRAALEHALGARLALQARAAADPATALISGNEAFANAGADYLLKSEARTISAAERFGAGSPEFRDVQQYALRDLLKSAIVAKQMAKNEGYSTTISGTALNDALSKYTTRQQELLFDPAVLADVKLLVAQANAMFPELRQGAGSSIAGANVMGNITQPVALRHYAMIKAMGWLADNPTYMRMVVGTLHTDPYTGRGILGWLLQGGVESMKLRGRATADQNSDDDFSRAMQLAVPTAKPKPKLPAQYGGPVE